ncbi:MAG: hypothetical protein JAY75_16675 [Candidatus Thiodiazotropha taylori]|nr:hypothetical protein [Candidatus Thiodiazotropha taylori]MCW4225283.1 hypothetical protein [Candidatus Thiodiazotropha endolucinida]MCG8032895.1 hypothetical protein [Candidatus Thiodiazotropha taylori]MCG8077856.1 hypothetical protein [Candidatus Thiodiazotropha taylori]MCG8116277.1 hypothetical protein [Candidatus Thiodiazotropha taylori]
MDNYGKQIEDGKILDWIKSESVPLFNNSEDVMEIVSPVYIADERLGWVRIALSKKEQLENTETLTR